MKYQLFNILNEVTPYLLVGNEHLYLLSEIEYNLLQKVGTIEALEEVKKIPINQVARISAARKEKEIRGFDSAGNELIKFKFSSLSLSRKFLKSLPVFEKSKQGFNPPIKAFNALLLLLFSYSFIWAGTRVDVQDIDPEGVRLNIVRWQLELLKFLNDSLGQSLLLLFGLLLLFSLIYFIFKPQIEYLFAYKTEYINMDNKKQQ